MRILILAPARYGEKRGSTPRYKTYLGYGKADLARRVQRTPGWISALCKRGDLKVLIDNSVDKESAHAWFRDELIENGYLSRDGTPSTSALREHKAAIAEEQRFNETIADSPELATGDDGEPPIVLHEARGKLLHFQAENERIKAAKDRRRTIDRELARRTVKAASDLVESELRALTDRLAPQVTGFEDERAIWLTIGAECKATIRALARKIAALETRGDS